MNAPPQNDANASGGALPLGGIGAGGVGLGTDGHFRAITIHHNAAAPIPRARHSFPALRLATPGGVWTRALQEPPPEADGGEAAAGRWIPPGALRARLVYPTAHFQVADPACPAQVVWTAFAPIIPFDHEASALPVLCVSVRVANAGDAPMDAACVMHWENLCGHTGARRPPEAARPQALQLLSDRAPGAREAEWRNAVLLAPAAFDDNADATHCVAAIPVEGDRVMAAAWDPETPGAREAFWTAFDARGDLEETPGGAPGAVAVCARAEIPPGGARRFDFVVAWHAPRHVADGADYGAGFAAQYEDAAQVARIALKHLAYYFASVEHWQRRLLDATLPAWFGRTLLDACRLFTTNTLATATGGFALVDRPDAPNTASTGARLRASFATLLLFPRFEETELALVAEAAALPEADGLPPARLGRGHLHAPGFDPREQLAAAAGMVLSACRNYVFTGNLVRARALLPRVEAALDRLAALADADGLPAAADRPLDSGTASLLVAAFHAGALLCELLDRPEAAARHTAAGDRAAAGFERRYWSEAGHYQRFARGDAAEGADACDPGQLAGQAWADLIGLGDLFDPARIARAVAGAAREPHDPVAEAAHLGALRVARGDTAGVFQELDRALRAARAADRAEGGDIAGLAVWRLLHAVLGFRLDLARRTLVIAPNLPPGAHSVEAPLFSPACLGWLAYRGETRAGAYRQRLRATFDSPVNLDAIQLRVPPGPPRLEVRVATSEGPVPCAARYLPEHAARQLHLRPERPLHGVTQLAVDLKGDAAP